MQYSWGLYYLPFKSETKFKEMLDKLSFEKILVTVMQIQLINQLSFSETILQNLKSRIHGKLLISYSRKRPLHNFLQPLHMGVTLTDPFHIACTNYHLISILSCLTKILKKECIKSISILYNHHYGFLKNHSTYMEFLELTDNNEFAIGIFFIFMVIMIICFQKQYIYGFHDIVYK